MLNDIKAGLQLNNHMWTGDYEKICVGSILTFCFSLPFWFMGFIIKNTIMRKLN